MSSLTRFRPLAKLRESLAEPRHLWRSASVSSRLMLLAGVFFLFAIVGLLSDLTAAIQHGNWWHLAFTGLFFGGCLRAYVLVIATRPAWLPLVVIVQIALTMYIASWEPARRRWSPAGALEHVLTSRLMTVASAIVACVSISWAFLISWVTKSGRRYVQLDTELHLARDIHRSLVPRIETRIGGFDFLGVSSPSGEVGGDLVDVVEHDGEPEWTAYLVDVSGHGVPSGVLMGMVKSAVRMALTTPTPLESMLAGLNDVLYEISQPQMFATFGALRPAGPGRMAYTLAGHLPILCWRAATDVVEELAVSQVPLGDAARPRLHRRRDVLRRRRRVPRADGRVDRSVRPLRSRVRHGRRASDVRRQRPIAAASSWKKRCSPHLDRMARSSTISRSSLIRVL